MDTNSKYPRMLYRGTTDDQRIVSDEIEHGAASEAGYVELDDLGTVDLAAGAQETAPDTEKVQLADDLASAKELIAKLDEAGQRVTAERDEARSALSSEQSSHSSTKSQLSSVQAQLDTANEQLTAALAEVERLKGEVAKVDGDGDGKVGGTKTKGGDKPAGE